MIEQTEKNSVMQNSPSNPRLESWKTFLRN